MDLTHRPRRLRTDALRFLMRETSIDASDLVAPVFVDATTDERVPIESMPGHDRVPIAEAADRVREIEETGVEAVILFGIPTTKDAEGSRAWAADGVVQKATRKLKDETDVTVITDVCLCEYTDHGHCGVLTEKARRKANEKTGTTAADGGVTELSRDEPALTVENDRTLDLLSKIAVSHAEAGADMVAPSSMTDGQVKAIRAGLDNAGYENRPIMSYAAKFQSAFYGPFRDAADGAPAFGDRRHYQMDPANAREAMREITLDIEEGADALIVKPALPYLDIVSAVRRETTLPVVAYNVSGEYAMLHAAADRGWLTLEEVAYESLLSVKRAGADLVITYFAENLADRL